MRIRTKKDRHKSYLLFHVADAHNGRVVPNEGQGPGTQSRFPAEWQASKYLSHYHYLPEPDEIGNREGTRT